MLSVFLSAPKGVKAPLVDRYGVVWTIPRDGYLTIDFEADAANDADDEVGRRARQRVIRVLFNP